MMRMRNTKTTGMGLELPSPTTGTATVGGGRDTSNSISDWEMRPGGMLVQKRTDSDQIRVPPPTIRIRVKYGSIYHEVRISSQATYGELKKMLSGPTGLHHQDQKLLYKDKERDSNAFLDTSGVKDKSKLVLIEDPISQEKRYIEMKKNAKSEKAAKSISQISLDIDRLAGKVSALETVISRSGKVVEKDLVNLIESLMNQLLKLDGINAEGDVKLQRKMQVRRVQKEVEKLDMMKIKNSTQTTPDSNGNLSSIHPSSPAAQQQQQRPLFSYEQSSMMTAAEQPQTRQSSAPSLQQKQPSRSSSSGSVVITTQWETFDSTPAIATLPVQSSMSARATAAAAAAAAQPSFTWDLL